MKISDKMMPFATHLWDGPHTNTKPLTLIYILYNRRLFSCMSSTED